MIFIITFFVSILLIVDVRYSPWRMSWRGGVALLLWSPLAIVVILLSLLLVWKQRESWIVLMSCGMMYLVWRGMRKYMTTPLFPPYSKNLLFWQSLIIFLLVQMGGLLLLYIAGKHPVEPHFDPSFSIVKLFLS